MFKSVDGGVTWAIVNSEMPARYVDAMAFDPTNANTIYASARDNLTIYDNPNGANDSIFKSTNTGANWIAINNGLPNSDPKGVYETRELTVDPLTPTTVYADFSYHGQFRSTDGGASWNAFGPCADPKANCSVQSLAIDPNNPRTIYGSLNLLQMFNPTVVSKSTDGGATWQQVAAGIIDNNGGRERVRPFHGRAQQEGRPIWRHGDDIRHLVLHAERERAPITHDQRCSPRVRSQYIGLPAIAERRIRRHSWPWHPENCRWRYDLDPIQRGTEQHRRLRFGG